MNFLLGKLIYIVIIAVTTLVALTGHELAHGWVSGKLGDPTPKMQGRMTLNPLAHLDLIGTILMLLTGFGWAQPVVVNPMYYKDRKKGMALVAFAGPMANFIMAFAGMIIGMLLIRIFDFSQTVTSVIGIITQVFVTRNLCFMVFNLIPLPPLDGAKVLGMFLPNRTYYTMLQYERYSMIILMLLSLLGIFNRIIGTGVNVVWNLIWHLASAIVF